MEEIKPSLADPALPHAPSVADPNSGWQTVTYAKRSRKQPPPAAAATDPDRRRPNGVPDRSNVFASVEEKARERRRDLEAAAASAALVEELPAVRLRLASDDEDDESDAEAPREDGGEAVKKAKPKKPKKPKVTVAEAAANIDAGDLAAHLVEISSSYESKQDIQLMRFADYFGRSFASVSASQFPWAKVFKESPVSKIVDIPLCHISDIVYKTATDWVGQRSPEALGDFALWCLDSILADLSIQQSAVKGSKKVVQQSPARTQVAIFVILAMTLRRKPDTLINLLPKLKDNTKFQGQEKLPVIIWVIAQASQGDLTVGMYLWAHYLFPTICGKSGGNPQSRDFILQLVERILSAPKARTILMNGAVRKGERLVPPASLDMIMRATFPLPTARIKATERFEAIYPTLKELALAGAPGSKTMKQASQQLLPACMKSMQEGNPELTREASDVFIWCLTQNLECYKQWAGLHLENVEASVAVLRKLSIEWKEYSAKLSPDLLRDTIKQIKTMAEQALSETTDSSKQAQLKEADKYCKMISGRLARGISCVKGGIVALMLALVVGFVMSPSMESLDWMKLHAMYSSPQS